MEMKDILLRIESRLDDLTKAFHQLKSENEILRKEILGVSTSQNSEAVGLMETRSLKEIVQQTEFCVNKLNSSEKENPKKSKPREKVKTMVREECNSESGSEGSDNESFEESEDKFPVVEIRSKTLVEEREIFKEIFSKLGEEKKAKVGESLQGTSVQKISYSIPWFTAVLSSCTMKLSNFLESTLTDPQYCFCDGSKNSRPTRVVGNFSEEFSFSGGKDRCEFLCSFLITKVLRLTIYSLSYSNGNIIFGIGFTPADVPTNQLLLSTLYSMPPAPDVWMMAKEYSKTPLELFVSHGNLLVRGHMTNGPRSIVLIEIMELLEISWPLSVVKGKKRLTDGKSLEFNQPTNKDNTISTSVGTSGRFSCNIEIANCLNVPLRNRNKWYSNSNKNDFWPLEIQSFHRESFLGSSVTNFDAIFAYEIVSTDLALIIALKVGPGTNSFAAAFSQIPAVNGKNELEALMNPNEWKIHNYKKCSNASKALEVISDRNIRAEILMTEKEESIFIIRIYAV